jgi:Ca2+-binding EF-hand superfamily protein
MTIKNNFFGIPSFTDYKSNLATALQNFDLTDRNHDNTLQVEELGTTSNSTKLYDLNHDGEVDKDELVAISNLLTRSTKYAEQHDKGKNGFPIEKEAFDGDWRQFQHFDVNQDNVISEEEHFNFLLTVRNERRRFDVNFDGDISFEEFGQSRLRFDFLDQDHDGLLDESEIGKGMVKGKW